ncbi:serine-rich adhesin for platelets [Nilaparvata lugens]|uniref:serine-rich adhesin for platelets n=1 Tax=Nilaparvata lugens TaxID=108931 RepID=UPI00193D9DF5|nr:serine-rich adhesin for platelets [Nilaparvata lugens]
MISNTWYLGVLWASILVFGQQKPRDTAVEITNDFSICLLQVIATPKTNAIFSPYGLVSVSVLIYEGANRSSESALQIGRALRLPPNSNTTQMGFRDLHMTMRASKYFTSDGFLRGLVLSNPKAVLHRSYLDKLKYYGFEPDVSSILTTTTVPTTTTAMPTNKTTQTEVVNKTTMPPTTMMTTTMMPTTELSGEDASTATSGGGSTEELTTTSPTDASVESKDGRADLDTTTVPSTTSGDSSTNTEEGSTEGSTDSREPLTEAPPNITTTPVTPTTGIKKSTTVDQDEEVSAQTPEGDESASTDNTDAASTEASSSTTSGSSEGAGEDSSTSASTAADDATSEDASQVPEQKTEATSEDASQVPEQKTEATVANAMVSTLEAQQPQTSTMMIDSQPTTTMEPVEAPTTSSSDSTTSDVTTTESVVTAETTTTISSPAETTTTPAETTTTTISPEEEATATVLDAVTISPPSMREANEIEMKLGELKALITSSLKENAKRLGILSKFEKFKELDEEHEKRLGSFGSATPSNIGNSSAGNDTENEDTLSSKMSIKTLFSDWVTIVPALAGSNEDYYHLDDSSERKTVTTTDDDIFGQSRDNKSPPTIRDREYEDYVAAGSGEDLLMTSSRRKEKFGGGAKVLEVMNREVVGVGDNGNATKNITKRSISGRLRMADWGQDNALYRVPPTQWFTTFSGQRMVPVLTLSAFLPFADLPTLGAQAIQIPLDAEFYTLLILIPKHRLGLKQLMYALQWCPLTGIIAALRTTPVYTVVPTFTMVTHINLVNPLMKLGIRDIFDQQRADLSEMSPDPNLFVRSVEQVITISVRKYYNTHYRWIDASPSQVQHQVLAMHPFIFFVVDTETKVALVSGTMVDPTLWAQQQQHPGY